MSQHPPIVQYPGWPTGLRRVGWVLDEVSRQRDRRDEGGEAWLLAGDENVRSRHVPERAQIELYVDPVGTFVVDATIEIREFFSFEFQYHALITPPPDAPIQGPWLVQICREGGEGRPPWGVLSLMPFDEQHPDTWTRWLARRQARDRFRRRRQEDPRRSVRRARLTSSCRQHTLASATTVCVRWSVGSAFD